MNKRAILVLALVVVGLVAYIGLFERKSLTSTELDERSGRVLDTFVRAKVDRLEVQRRGKRVVLERQPGEVDEFTPWTMLEPVKVEADTDAIDKVLGELEWLSARRTFDSLTPEDLRKFGLSAPRYRVSYRSGDARHVLAVGNADVHGEGVYVRVDAEPKAYVVPKTLVETLDNEPLHYRSKEFLGPMVTAWTRRLEIEAGGARAELIKDHGRFWVTGEIKSFADDKLVENLLRSLDELRAARFLEPEQAKVAAADLAKPARVVRVNIVPDEGREDQKPQQVELQLGGPCAGHEGERYARSGKQGAPVCILAAQQKPFEVSAVELRLARPIAADPSAIERLTLVRGARKLELKREGEKWLAADKSAIDREAVELWLESLGKQRALGFLAPGTFQEQGSLTLQLSDEKSERLAVGQITPDGAIYVQRAGEPARLTFPASLAELLDPSPRRFGPLEPWSAHQPSEVAGIEARDGSSKRSLQLVDGAWRTAGGAALPDSDALREVVRRLLKVRLVGFVSEQPRAEHGLTPAQGQLQLKLAAGKALALEVGVAGEGGSFARLDGGPVVQVGQEVLAQLQALAGTGSTTLALPESGPSAEEGEGEHEELGEHADHGHEDPGEHEGPSD